MYFYKNIGHAVSYLYEVDKKYHRYFVDLKITFKNKKLTVNYYGEKNE